MFLNQLNNLLELKSLFFSIFLIVGVGLLFIGLVGFLFVRRNIFFLMLNLELMLLGCSFIFLFSVYIFGNLYSYVFVFFILAFAAVEAAVGLALLLNTFAGWDSLQLDKCIFLRG